MYLGLSNKFFQTKTYQLTMGTKMKRLDGNTTYKQLTKLANEEVWFTHNYAYDEAVQIVEIDRENKELKVSDGFTTSTLSIQNFSENYHIDEYVE